MNMVPTSDKNSVIIVVEVASVEMDMPAARLVGDKLDKLIETLRQVRCLSEEVKVVAAAADSTLRDELTGRPWYVNIDTPFDSLHEFRSLEKYVDIAINMAAAWAKEQSERGLKFNPPILLLISDGKVFDGWLTAARKLREIRKEGLVDALVVALKPHNKLVLRRFSGTRPVVAFNDNWGECLINFYRHECPQFAPPLNARRDLVTKGVEKRVQGKQDMLDKSSVKKDSARPYSLTFTAEDDMYLDGQCLNDYVLPLVSCLEELGGLLPSTEASIAPLKLCSITQNSPIQITFNFNEFFRDLLNAILPLRRRFETIAKQQELEDKDLDIRKKRLELLKMEADFEESRLGNDRESRLRASQRKFEVLREHQDVLHQETVIRLDRDQRAIIVLHQLAELLHDRFEIAASEQAIRSIMPALMTLLTGKFRHDPSFEPPNDTPVGAEVESVSEKSPAMNPVSDTPSLSKPATSLGG